MLSTIKKEKKKKKGALDTADSTLFSFFLKKKSKYDSLHNSIHLSRFLESEMTAKRISIIVSLSGTSLCDWVWLCGRACDYDVCVRACVSACVPPYARACVCACVYVCC